MVIDAHWESANFNTNQCLKNWSQYNYEITVMEQIEMLKSCQLVQRMLIKGFNGSKAEAN